MIIIPEREVREIRYKSKGRKSRVNGSDSTIISQKDNERSVPLLVRRKTNVILYMLKRKMILNEIYVKSFNLRSDKSLFILHYSA